MIRFTEIRIAQKHVCNVQINDDPDKRSRTCKRQMGAVIDRQQTINNLIISLFINEVLLIITPGQTVLNKRCLSIFCNQDYQISLF